MAFRLITAIGATEYDDDATYSFNDHGLLVIYDGGKRITFSPEAWLTVQEDVDTDGFQVF